MNKKTSTVIAVNRLSAALERHGVKLKRTQALDVAAAAFGYRNANEMTAAAAAEEFSPPKAQMIGRRHVDGIGQVAFLRDAGGAIFGVEEQAFRSQTGQAADWMTSPMGGLVDVSDVRASVRMHAEDPTGTGMKPPLLLDPEDCGAASERAIRHLAVRTHLNRAIYRAVRSHDMTNMTYAEDHGVAYPLVDLMSNPAPCDIGTGELEMVGLVDEIESAVRQAIGLPDVNPFDFSKEDAAKRFPRPEARRTSAEPYQGADLERYVPNDPMIPVYMTSGCCEVACVGEEDMLALGLPYGSFDGAFYPLTDEEGAYIAEDCIASDDGLHHALIAYSVLYRSGKWLMPTIEMAFSSKGDAPGEFPPRAQIIADGEAYADRIRPKVEAFGGEVMYEISYDRVMVKILVPFAKAMEEGDFDAWKETLAWLMVDPALPTVLRGDVRHSGSRFRVTASWIGEGQEGDYSPDEPCDRPLLRLDADHLVDGRWEEVNGGSHCCQVAAYAEPKIIQALVRMAVKTLEDGNNPKRDSEGLSWVDELKVREWLANEDMKSAEADFVSHATYGNPNAGTSIDLRRRDDGSVRCEVYVDLACVALLDARGGMDEVRTWLKSLPADVEAEHGSGCLSWSLAPRWMPSEDEAGSMQPSWQMVPASQDQAAWFAKQSSEAPFARCFVTIDEMDA